MASLKIKKKKPSLRANIIGFVFILLCVGTLFITSAGNLSVEIIERHLQLLAQNVSKQAADNGKEGKLAWGEITVNGWGYDKIGLVQNLSVLIGDKGAIDSGNKWTVSTASATVPPETKPDVLTFLFPDPINVSQNNELKSTLVFSAPAKYEYTNSTTPGTGVESHHFILPGQLTITPAQTATDKAPKNGKLTVTYDAAPIIRSTKTLANNEREVELNFHNFKISADDGELAAVTSLRSLYKEVPKADRMEGSYKLEMSDLLIRQPNGMMKPYSFGADLSFTTFPPTTTTDETGATVVTRGAADINLGNLSLLTNEFELKLSGTISAAADDPLLFGDATLYIKNAGNFIANPLLPQEVRPIIEIALQKITGAGIDATTELTIPLKRDKNGVFMLGTITFEELAAAVFSEMLRNQPTVTELPAGQPQAAPGAAPVSPVVSGPAGDLPEPSASEGE